MNKAGFLWGRQLLWPDIQRKPLSVFNDPVEEVDKDIENARYLKKNG